MKVHGLLSQAGIQTLEPGDPGPGISTPRWEHLSSSLSVFIHLNLLSLTIVIIPGIHFVKVY